VSARTRFSSGAPFEDRFGYCRAIRIGDRVLVAGTAPIWPDGSCDPDPVAQARRCLEIIVNAIREAGGGPEHVVRTRMFVTSAEIGEAVGRAHAEVFGDAPPVSTMVVITALLDPRFQVEIEAEAIID
jgi:enamine deaminase RidA (YjgF/YER057c/UK114 family)